jgi:hypothetical protein
MDLELAPSGEALEGMFAVRGRIGSRATELGWALEERHAVRGVGFEPQLAKGG